MTDLLKYIKELLLTHDCVIIPNFGGFICNYNSAKIDEARQIFIPPSKSLVFNKNLSTNDGLLLNYITNIENLNYFEAKNKLNEQIDLLKHYLNFNKQAEIKEVGTLFFDSNNNILFEPLKQNNLFINSFGLSEFTFPIIEKIPHEIADNIYSEKYRPQKKKKISYTKFIVIPLAVAFLLSPFKTSIFDSNKQNSIFKIDTNYNLASNPITDALDKNAEKTNALMYSEKNNSFEIKENIIAEIDSSKLSTTQIEDIEPITKNNDELNKKNNISQIDYSNKGNCFIIAGCFKDLTNAESLQKIFQNKGIKSEILVDKGFHKISLGNFESRTKAELQLQNLKTIDTELQAWVMVK